MKAIAVLTAALLTAVASSAQAPHAGTSAYVGQESREIKALSADEVQSYLSGKGMGLAKAAELNGYPGPSHVLALAAQLGLTPKQKSQTQALFASMESRAVKLGAALVDEERGLDRSFAGKTITPEALARSLARIGQLQAEVREAHLEAHLAQVRILNSEQVALYMQLRGYASDGKKPAHEHSHPMGG